MINEEVKKLKKNGFIREVEYLDWLANMVVVRKKNGKPVVCINFIDINMVRPKDSFTLSKIKMMVDAMTWHELLSFMDAYSDYNQIMMHPHNQEKTSFITKHEIFCYKVMLFRLKMILQHTNGWSIRCLQSTLTPPCRFISIICLSNLFASKITLPIRNMLSRCWISTKRS